MEMGDIVLYVSQKELRVGKIVRFNPYRTKAYILPKNGKVVLRSNEFIYPLADLIKKYGKLGR